MIYEISKDQINQIFEEARGNPEPHQYDYAVGLWRLACETAGVDWDLLPKGISPTLVRVSPGVNSFIFRKAIAFDQQYHTSISGGLWMNIGFSTDTSLDGMEIFVSPRLKMLEITKKKP